MNDETLATPMNLFGRFDEVESATGEAVISLRDYQSAACNRTWELFQSEGYRKLLGVAATGSGKTVMFSDLCKRAHALGERSLVLVDQEDLVDQAAERLFETTGLEADIEQAERRADPGASIIISTVQSMRRRLEKYEPESFGLIIADEADRSAAPQWRSVLEFFDQHARVLGVTATPNRADRQDIMDYFEAKAFDIALFDLVRAGYLAKIVVRTVPLEIDIRDVKQKSGDYDAAQLDEALQRYFGEICDAIARYAADRKILIFWPLIHTSREFVDVARANGLEARHIDGASPNRGDLQRAFRRREIQILSNALLMSRGYDDPSIDCIINCRVTRHVTMYQQIIGRGTRIFCPRGCTIACDHAERKRDLLVLDFLWQFEKYGIARPADLIASSKRQADAITAKIESESDSMEVDLEWADSEVAREHEIALLEEFDRMRKRSGTVFNALEWAANMDIRELVDFEPETARDSAALTEHQKQRLTKAGFLLTSVRGYGHAERIIAILDERIRKGLATFKQVHWLRRFGHADAMDVSFEEAKKLLDRYFTRRHYG